MNEFNFKTSMGDYKCTPDNTIAFVHSPQYKDVDHIFRHLEDMGEEEMGIFAFRAVFGVVFNRLVQDMEESGYTVVYHEVPTELDMNQFIESESGDLEEWWEHLDGSSNV